ncbi:MAG TPA: pyridoxal-phosphate dependent enzyme [Cytophagales bacterium]|nr:pyridoxal-phosphate dependent enzyme [Cytophagales bacterium]
MFDNPGEAYVELIKDEELQPFGVSLYVKREDLIHPFISGNKWRKLKYNFLKAQESGLKTILTVGGAFSNHIAAVAAAGKEYGFKTLGVIRGEEHLPLNPTLYSAKANGMEIIYFPRDKFRQGLSEDDFKAIEQTFGKFIFIPEGGTNEPAIQGTSEIINDIKINFSFICCAVGTGGTVAGLIQSNKQNAFSVLGFSALKNSDYLTDEVRKLTGDNQSSWKITNDYAFGGYAKFNNLLIDFINRFKALHGIQLDPIYTGKMMFGIYDLIKKGYFPNGSTIIAVHTGGLQGIVGFNERFGNLIH